MDVIIACIHYASAILTIVLPALGVTYAQAQIGKTASRMINEQPEAANALRKVFLISTVVVEATITIALIITLLFCFRVPHDLPEVIANCGVLLAVGFTGMCIGFYSAEPAKNAILGLAREPFEDGRATNLALITLTIMQTPTIFGFVISWLIFSQSVHASWSLALSLLASGIALGLGAFGPLRGQRMFASEACSCIGINKHAYSRVLSFTFVSQILIETPILFSFVTSMIIILLPLNGYLTDISGVKAIAAALAIALSTLCAGISSGRVSRTACSHIIQHPQNYSLISKTSIISQVLIDTNVIFGFITMLFIVFWL